MAGLSIKRRRKAWLRGVAAGARGGGKCRLEVPKLVAIFQRGLEHGRANVDTPYVRAILDQTRRGRPQSGRPQGEGLRGRQSDRMARPRRRDMRDDMRGNFRDYRGR